MAAPVLNVDRLSVRFGDVLALENIGFALEPRAYSAVIGPNGAGKSTLMQAIMGLVPLQPGSVLEVDRARLGYVPQHQDVDWSFPVTVRDVVMMGLVRAIGWLRLPGQRHWQQADAALERVGMLPFARRAIGELSDGQRQRVFIARALVQAADILLLDEPFAGVDVAAQAGLLDVIEALNRRDGITVLVSTHDLGLAAQRFTTVMALNRTLVAFGSPQAVLTPETLRALYGGAVATVDAGGQVQVYVDEDVHCC